MSRKRFQIAGLSAIYADPESGGVLKKLDVLYPLDDFHELLKARVGDVCAAALHIESASELHRQAAMPQPKKKAVFQPKPKSLRD